MICRVAVVAPDGDFKNLSIFVEGLSASEILKLVGNKNTQKKSDDMGDVCTNEELSSMFGSECNLDNNYSNNYKNHKDDNNI